MTTSFSEAAKLSKLSKERLESEIDEYAAQYRPKILEQRQENGYTYTRYEAAHAENCGCHQYVKPTGRSGSYEL